MDEELGKPFAVCDAAILNRQFETVKSLLVIGDNTGETVFECYNECDKAKEQRIACSSIVISEVPYGKTNKIATD